MPLAIDPIMWGTSIPSFRHLEHQNLSIISGDIGRDKLDVKFVTEEERNRTVSSIILDDMK